MPSDTAPRTPTPTTGGTGEDSESIAVATAQVTENGDNAKNWTKHVPLHNAPSTPPTGETGEDPAPISHSTASSIAPRRSSRKPTPHPHYILNSLAGVYKTALKATSSLLQLFDNYQYTKPVDQPWTTAISIGNPIPTISPPVGQPLQPDIVLQEYV